MVEASDSWRDKLRLAHESVCEEIRKFPEERALLSCLRQLEYLIALEDGIEKDDGALERISIGYMASKPLAGVISDSLDKLLCEISGEVRQTLRKQGRRLKIDLPNP